MDAGNFAATGVVSGAVLAVGYILYKLCYKRKFHSKCCGAEMDVAGEPSPRKEVQIELGESASAADADVPARQTPRQTPRASPALRPAADADADLQIPKLQV
jgi:hypothetical protein